ncbi:MAG: TolC family protein [Candidatus Gastranaerophilaceae bacterium]
MYISLVSDIASAYVNIIKFDKLIEIQEKIVGNNQSLYDKTKLRYDNGISSETDLNLKNMIDAQNELIEYDKNRQNLLYELAVMTGECPQCVVCSVAGLMNFKGLCRPTVLPQM